MALLSAGHRSLVGIDEVGRGAWAGPVVAGAVSVPLAAYADPAILAGVDDSKRLSASRRERLASEIRGVASAAVGWVDPRTMDALGAGEATRLAMRAALAALATSDRDGAVEGLGWHARRVSGPAILADVVLVDGHPIDGIAAPQRAFIKGDRLCLAIAAASIVAKVARDRYMTALAHPFPAYGFDRHAGYGTRQHFTALLRHGVTPQHRRRFQPVRHLDQCAATSTRALPPGADRSPRIPLQGLAGAWTPR